MKVSNNTAGFSLVELMVVVAIIGILATIAIPNFTKFQAKAKQSNAKSELTGIYTAEKAFYTEYSVYHTNLAYIGYIPDGFPIASDGCPSAGSGVRYYTTGFLTDGTVDGTQANDQPSGGPAVPAACDAITEIGGARYNSTVFAPGTSAVITLDAGNVSSASAFSAHARGNVSGRTALDTWTIDQDKTLSNPTSGI